MFVENLEYLVKEGAEEIAGVWSSCCFFFVWSGWSKCGGVSCVCPCVFFCESQKIGENCRHSVLSALFGVYPVFYDLLSAAFF